MRGVTIALGALAWASAARGVSVDANMGAQSQIPLRAPEDADNFVSNEEWSFTNVPPGNETAQLVFSTVQNLLQHWPNTRYRNGHTIVPSIVPVGTLLYHGTSRGVLPPMPEWTATDPEHSFLFCRSLSVESGCWHLTLVATRPLKVLYFDGSSAAKMLGGPMDTQDLVTWGEVRPERTFDERGRIVELCNWGKDFGVDGFARMEMDFEIMLCDFTAGVETASFLNLKPPEEGGIGGPPGRRPDESPAPAPSPQSTTSRPALVRQALEQAHAKTQALAPKISNAFRVLEAGSWHNHFPGETRLKLDYALLISFYDPILFPSLVRAREGQTRLQHRLDGLSKEDSAKFRARLEAAYNTTATGGQESGSGVDWSTLLNTVTERFAERLELLAYILNVTDLAMVSETEAENRLLQAHRHLISMVGFYNLKSAEPPSARVRGDHAWATSVWEHCATTHTRYLDASVHVRGFTDSETLLLGAIKGVQKEVCRVIVGLWAEGVELDLHEPDDKDDDARLASRLSSVSAKELATEWTQSVEDLMAWLDWSYWLRCRPACNYEEMCYLPTWPFFKGPQRRGPRPGPFANQVIEANGVELDGPEEEESDWEDPQPRCIRRVEPFGLRD